jgi:NAD(P)-dependent dehydrogenase (short-subunit alcohol dehydrogenase family)
MKDFKSKVAVITGAASGIGYGLAERCAKEGMKVVLAGINEGNLKRAEKEILEQTGAETLVVRCDVSRAEDVEALARKTLDTYGAVHLLFNNAGVGTFNSTWESTLEDWEWVMGVNLWGVIHGIHYFVPIMIKQNTECHIVNTSSVAGLNVGTFMSPYNVTKHGVVVLSEILYLELEATGQKNIGVSALCPGLIKSKIMDCERNRPVALKNDSGTINPNAKGMEKMLGEGVTEGMPAEQLAEIVFAAIKARQFYILPNAEFIKPAVQMRLENIIREHNPRPFAVPE